MVKDCLFCRIASGDLPADVVAEDEHTLAFRDINPQAPTHVLVIPRKHHANVAELTAADGDALKHLIATAVRVAAQEGVAESGYRLVFNTGDHAGQTVRHVHGHVLGGQSLGWPPA